MRDHLDSGRFQSDYSIVKNLQRVSPADVAGSLRMDGLNQQKSSVPLFSDLYELFAKGIFVPVQDQAGMQAFKGD